MKARNMLGFIAAAAVALPSALPVIDTDADGLDDAVETNTGVYVPPANTGTKLNNPDSDGDGAGDCFGADRADRDDGRPRPLEKRIRLHW